MDLHKFRYLAPNSLTMASLFCGFNSILVAVRAESAEALSLAAWLIVAAMIFDHLDGRVARMAGAESELGVQLDSLADSVSFGIAPAFLLFAWGLSSLGMAGLVVAFVFAACAVFRLARYNVMSNQQNGPVRYFLGLPTPLAAGAVVSIVMAHLAVTGSMHAGADYSVAGMTLLLSGLMVSNVRYRTFKDVKIRSRAALPLGTVILASMLLGIVLQPSVAFVLLMVIYILVGLLGGLIEFSRGVFTSEAEELEDLLENRDDLSQT